MGRYYNGDIEGKFWFGVQSSTDADFFGVIHEEVYYKKCGCEADERCDCEEKLHSHSEDCDESCKKEFDEASVYGEPSCVRYQFVKRDIKDVKEGIEVCLIKLGEYKDKLDTYYNKEDLDITIESYLDVSKERAHKLVEWFARLTLGQQILDCLNEKDRCFFTCEI